MWKSPRFHVVATSRGTEAERGREADSAITPPSCLSTYPLLIILHLCLIEI